MGLFSSSKKSKALKNEAWIALQSMDQLDELQKQASKHPVIIFKHSTRCSISHFVHRQLASKWNFDVEDLPFYYLDLIKHRNVSNAVADRTGVQHESPQMILWYKGQALYEASHNNIDLKDMEGQLPSTPN